MAKKLLTLLEGEEALVVWLELTTEEKASYGTSKSRIIELMAPIRFASLDDFCVRKLSPGKPLSVYLHKLKQLFKRAMSNADAAMQNQLLLHQFVSGLPGHISKQLRVTGEITELNRRNLNYL